MKTRRELGGFSVNLGKTDMSVSGFQPTKDFWTIYSSFRAESIHELFALITQVRSEGADDPVHTLNHNPFKPNRISHNYQLDQSISILKVVGWYFTFLFKLQ